MVNHCAVGGCNNRQGRDTSGRRSFLVFHTVPRDAKRRKAWDKRVNRADHDIRRLKTYRVCSDHFRDSDYQKKDWEHYEKTGAGNITSSRMTLNDTCISNTDPNTGEIVLCRPSTFREKFPNTDGSRYTGFVHVSELMMDIFCHELNKSLFVSRKIIYNLRLV